MICKFYKAYKIWYKISNSTKHYKYPLASDWLARGLLLFMMRTIEIIIVNLMIFKERTPLQCEQRSSFLMWLYTIRFYQ